MDLSQFPPAIAKQLLGWKHQYGELIYVPYDADVMEFGHVDAFVFKVITLKQYDLIKVGLEFEDAQVIDEIAGQILQECLLWPKNMSLDLLEQSDFKRLYQKVSEKSPFSSLEAFDEFVLRSREKYSDLKSLICAFISAAFPTLSINQVEDLNNKELGQYLISAEHILQRPFEVPGVKPKAKKGPPSSLSPDEVKAARHMHAANRRDQAISKAQDRKQARVEAMKRNRETGEAIQIFNPDGTPNEALMRTQAQPSPSIPTPAAMPPPSMQQPESGDRLEGMDRVNGDTPIRRVSADEILDDEEPMMDKDFKRDKRKINEIWNRPEDGLPPNLNDGPIVLGG